MDANKLLDDIEKVNMNDYSTLEECLGKNVTFSGDEYPIEYVDVTHRLCQRWVYSHGIDNATKLFIEKLGYSEGLNYWRQDMTEVAMEKIVRETIKNGFEDVKTDAFKDNYCVNFVDHPMPVAQLPLKPLGNELMDKIDKLNMLHDSSSEFNDIYLNIHSLEESGEMMIQMDILINSDGDISEFDLTQEQTQAFLEAYPCQALCRDELDDTNIIVGIARTEEEADTIKEYALEMQKGELDIPIEDEER